MPAKETTNETKMKGKGQRRSDLCIHICLVRIGTSRSVAYLRPRTHYWCRWPYVMAKSGRTRIDMTNLLPADANSLEFIKSGFTCLPYGGLLGGAAEQS